jgi:hypothetical protein
MDEATAAVDVETVSGALLCFVLHSLCDRFVIICDQFAFVLHSICIRFETVLNSLCISGAIV